jgi:cytochrome c2
LRRLSFWLALFPFTVSLLGCGLVETNASLQPGFADEPNTLEGSRQVPGGVPEQGRQVLQSRYGCGACHVIPGVPGAQGQVGPPLSQFARRSLIAGRLPNSADNLVAWIRTPQALEPGTGMPDLGVSEADARDVAAYLYTLR